MDREERLQRMICLSDQKKCFKCHTLKPLSEFYRHSRMADGRLNKCKECTKLDVHVNYFTKRDFYAHYEQQRFQRTERKKHIQVYQKKRRALHPEKCHANCLTSNAIRDGRLKRQPCETCGAYPSEAHHKDYNKPFEITWLCREHHLAEHGKVAYASPEKGLTKLK